MQRPLSIAPRGGPSHLSKSSVECSDMPAPKPSLSPRALAMRADHLGIHLVENRLDALPERIWHHHLKAWAQQRMHCTELDRRAHAVPSHDANVNARPIQSSSGA